MQQRGMDMTMKLRGDLQAISHGGYGDVFRGYLEDGTAVAIKRHRMNLFFDTEQEIRKVSFLAACYALLLQLNDKR